VRELRAFRDLLQSHPDLRQQYEDLKRRLADAHRNDRDAYTRAKTGFIENALREAGIEPKPRPRHPRDIDG
jgi:GrpB-like predicted nucleotidyltransferase (UPF0157 family)